MTTKTTTSERDALAARYFPDSWKSALAPGKSKKRNQLRNAAEDMQKKERLRAIGASCANCANFGKAQIGGETKTICEIDSDFYGYLLAKPENLCHRWKDENDERI